VRRPIVAGLRLVLSLTCLVAVYWCLRTVGIDLYALFFDPEDRLLKRERRRDSAPVDPSWRG
jgi:hypothetical protein